VCPNFFLEIITNNYGTFVMLKYFLFIYLSGIVTGEKERKKVHLSRGQAFGKYPYFSNAIII